MNETDLFPIAFCVVDPWTKGFGDTGVQYLCDFVALTLLIFWNLCANGHCFDFPLAIFFFRFFLFGPP